jgi:hypothetical protein
MRATLPLRARSMLPWALDRSRSRCCRACRAAPSFDGTFRLAAQPLRRPSTRTSREGNGVPALSGSVRSAPRSPPKERLRRIALAPAPPEGDTSAASQHGPRRTVGCQRIRPERRSTASVPAPEGARLPTSSRRISEETRSRPSARSEERQPVVRAGARHPSAVTRVHDVETARRGREHPKVRASARHSRAPRKVLRRTSRGIPKDSARGEPGGATRRWAVAGSWLRRLQQAGGPARARQSSCSPGRPCAPKRAGVRLVPHIPPGVVIRREHRSALAEMDRGPSQAVPTGVEAASVPGAPKRSRSPVRREPDGR